MSIKLDNFLEKRAAMHHPKHYLYFTRLNIAMLKKLSYVFFLMPIIGCFAMEKEIYIRASVEEDAFEVEKLRIKCWQNHFSGILDKNFLESLDPEKSYKARQMAISSQKDVNLVAIFDGKIIALSDGGEKRPQQGNLIEGEIYSLYVDEQFRKKGIGSLLFQKQCDLLQQRGFEKVLLWVLKENVSARNFYNKLNGLLGEEKYFNIGGKNYLQVVYQWQIKKN